MPRGKDIINLEDAEFEIMTIYVFFQIMSDNSGTDKTELATEVLWCIQHLEGLLDKGKLSEKKKKEARTCYKLLKNPDTPLPKLRQAMRTSCGDYKAKMLAEEKEVKLDSDQISRCDANKSQQQSNFIKKSVSKSNSDKVEFKFNFNIDS